MDSLVNLHIHKCSFQKNNKDNNIHFVSLRELDLDQYKGNDIVFVFTDYISPQFFNKLMGTLTTYPPVIEGANAIEFCESLGLPYITAMRLLESAPILHYTVPAFHRDRQRHVEACHCLTATDGEGHIQALADYMKDSKQLNNLQYHQARKGVHLSRPDGVKVSLDALEFTYNQKSSLIMSRNKSQETQDNTSIATLQSPRL